MFKLKNQLVYFSRSCIFLPILTSISFAENSSQVIGQSTVVIHSCERIAKKLASVSFKECKALNLQQSALSEQGFPLLLKEFSPLAGKQPMGRVLLIGGIHGDEYSSVSVSFKWLTILAKHHSGLFHWQVAPLVNPDGLLRKKSHRMNQNGVDLNRNFPSQELSQAHLDYWQKHTFSDPRRYPGKQPLSEKESQWVDTLINQFKPDVIVSLHAPFGLVDYDSEIEHDKVKAVQPPSHLGSLHLHLLGTYPGSLGRYGSEVLDIPVLTVELKYAGIMPTKQEISHIWVDLIAWLKKYLATHAIKKAVF